MTYQELEREGLIRPSQIRSNQIQRRLHDAAQHLADAQGLLALNSFDNAYRLAYDAVLAAAEAFMFSKGYRARSREHHKAVVRFIKLALGPRFASQTSLFDQMREKRHRLYYEGMGFVSKEESKKAIAFANQFVEELRESITRQMKLDL